MPRFFKIGDINIAFRKKEVSPEIQARNWKNVEAAIKKEKASVFWIKPALVAASVLVVAITLVWVLQKNQPQQHYFSEIRTALGEVKRITLPDSTVIVLNANSVLKVPKQWKQEEHRHVWLDGEAYFNVTNDKIKQLGFTVHTDEVAIDVLGTKFNVNTRHEQSTVALEEGKIRLSVSKETAKNMKKESTPLIMKPGEVAVVNKTEIVKVKADTAVNIYSGWARNEFHFSNTSLAEVAKMIRETYGYDMEVSDSTLWDKQISGELRANTINELAQVLEVILKRKITIKDKTLVIEHY